MLVLSEHDDKLTLKGALGVPLRWYEGGEEAEAMQDQGEIYIYRSIAWCVHILIICFFGSDAVGLVQFVTI